MNVKRSLKINLIVVGLLLLVLVLGCGDGGSSSDAKTSEKKIPTGYVGMWTGRDGSTITIRNDGTGDYKSGGTSMSGGSVEVDEAAKEIRFSLMLFDAKYKIDEPPKNNRMKLDGMEYRRTGGFDLHNEQTTETAEVPLEDELRPLVYHTLVDFNRAIQSGDFTEFYQTISQKWQGQTSAAVFNKAFAATIKNKSDYAPRSEETLDFAPKPSIEDKVYLLITSKYVTVTGKTSNVRLSYLRENEEWKLFGIELNPK